MPTRADRIVLEVEGVGPWNIYVYLSSVDSTGYDYTFTSAEVEAVTVANGSEIHLDRLAALPRDLMVDKVRVRATAGAMCVNSACVRDGRTMDPTRSVANFWGIPAQDDIAPTVLSAVSASDQSVIVTFSEPVRVEAANPSNFEISPDLTVLTATLTAHHDQILLTTSPQAADVRLLLRGHHL